jgi:putative OmpL-like beta-barrel porin-2
MHWSMFQRTYRKWVIPLACPLLISEVAFAQAPAAPPAPPPAAETPPPAAPPPAAAPAAPPPAVAAAPAATAPPAPAAPAEPGPFDGIAQSQSPPFAMDFGWINGTSRQKKPVIDTPYFTGEFLVDVNYTQSAANPIDHTVVGSTSIARNNEVALSFLGLGGDFHIKNTRMRIMTQFGYRAVEIPRNDFSTFHGQFDLQNTLRYISEWNGGYHFDWLHGVNIDAGIFMSYVGLFSYTAYENWMYVPSYTSDNTPWFFNGIRIQIFPTDTLKIEPWIINGWQSYAKFNDMPGFGGQIMWRPVEWISMNSNDYFGYDAQDLPGLDRWHTDNSFNIRYYNNPGGSFITRAAASYTFDLGGEQGDGVSFSGTSPEGHCSVKAPCPARFISAMTYQRVWFGDQFAVTVGGGYMSNPSRYLILTPTGNAQPLPQPESTAQVAYVPPTSPYDINFGSKIDMWDYEGGFQYMPSDYFTLDVEYNHRSANVPFFAGHGGVTSPDGYVTTPSGPGWRPDLTKSDDRIIIAWLVRL